MATYTQARTSFRTPAGRNAVFGYRPETNDWNVLNSIAGDNDEYDLPTGLSGTALDVGAHIGGVTVCLALDNPELFVIAVEPVPANVELLRSNVADNGLSDRVRVIEGATGTGQVKVWYGYTGSDSLEHHAFIGNSTLAYDYPGEAPHEERTYTGLRIADLTPDDIAWAKVDTEGGEWDFLDDPDIARIAVITGEWHPVRGHTLGDMASLLGGTHVVTFSGPQAGPGGFRAVRR